MNLGVKVLDRILAKRALQCIKTIKLVQHLKINQLYHISYQYPKKQNHTIVSTDTEKGQGDHHLIRYHFPNMVCYIAGTQKY